MKKYKNYYQAPDNKMVLKKIREYETEYIDVFFPKDKTTKILDLACGYGIFLHTCNKLKYTNYEGVDISEKYLKYAKENLELSNIYHSDIFDYLDSKQDSSYDIITGFNIIEHVKKEKVEQLLNLIYSKLKPRGFFLMEVPNAESPLGIYTLYSDLTHELAFSDNIIYNLLDIIGFEKIEILPKFTNQNPLIRLSQKILAKIIGLDDKLMFTGNIIAIAYKKIK
jgi:2-polyprenyl-3-methyl-5-hydroxy-6-metoxy-1,4-benzoquinol methylase